MMIPIMGYAAAGSYVIPVAGGTIRLRGLDTMMKWFLLFTGLAFLDAVAQVILAQLGISNYFIINYYSIIEVSLMMVIFGLATRSSALRSLMKSLGLLFGGIWIIDKMYFEDPAAINSTMAVVSRIFLIIASLAILNSEWKIVTSKLIQRPTFWIASGVILHAGGTLFILGLSNTLLRIGMTYFEVAWYFNWILIIVSNLMFLKGFLCKSRPQQSSG